MKFNYLLKATPFLTTFLLIIIVSFSNQKEYSKLKILIWTTPSLSLSTYLSISTGAGFIISYLITTNLAKINQSTPKQSLNYKYSDNDEDSKEYKEKINNISYEKTLIERNISDPSPTINASFRIIGKTEKSDNFSNNNNNISYDNLIEFEDQYDQQTDNKEIINKVKSITNDWNDESFSSW